MVSFFNIFIAFVDIIRPITKNEWITFQNKELRIYNNRNFNNLEGKLFLECSYFYLSFWFLHYYKICENLKEKK